MTFNKTQLCTAVSPQLKVKLVITSLLKKYCTVNYC